jgi:FkbM family methyltransferase
VPTETEEARRLLLAAESQLREIIGTLPDSRERGLRIQEHWTVLRMLGHNQQFFSQAGQDDVLDREVFQGRRGGIFVEIGAYDGITGSNTLFFELFRGWSGLLIEASPRLQAQVRKLRTIPCLQVAVAEQAGYAEFLDVQRGCTQMGGLVKDLSDRAKDMIESHPHTVTELTRVATRPLADILVDQGLSRIDYVSIDIEGGELAVLSTFPFHRFDIGAWSIEVNEPEPQIARVMSDAGFQLFGHFGSDELYVHRQLMSRNATGHTLTFTDGAAARASIIEVLQFDGRTR